MSERSADSYSEFLQAQDGQTEGFKGHPQHRGNHRSENQRKRVGGKDEGKLILDDCFRGMPRPAGGGKA